MRPLQGSVWGCALAALLAWGTPARAAWNNVFQVCCHSCGSAPAPVVAGYYGGGDCCDPCPAPCPPVCTTRYVQRCYYQPVTCYRYSTYYEPVTTYRTSYYYEACTSYTYSCCYDPCTCRYQQVATPVTSYRLRSRCCPVTSYLQRTCATPVTTYRQAFYYEPVTTCCSAAAAPPCNGRPPASATPPPVAESREPAGAPPVTEGHGAPPVTESRKPVRNPPYMPPASDSAYRAPQLRRPIPATPRPAEAPPRVRFERIATLSGENVQGRVLTADRAPRSGARILFVSAESRGVKQIVAADRDGKFSASLSAGDWLVYVYSVRGKPVFWKRVEVKAKIPMRLTLVSR
jgi:hypothetical protein